MCGRSPHRARNSFSTSGSTLSLLTEKKHLRQAYRGLRLPLRLQPYIGVLHWMQYRTLSSMWRPEVHCPVPFLRAFSSARSSPALLSSSRLAVCSERSTNRTISGTHGLPFCVGVLASARLLAISP